MMKYRKILWAVLAFALLFTSSLTAFANENNKVFSDVSSEAWYAGAVAYVNENNLMDGTSESEFAPNIPASRITLAVALYRAENSPTVLSPIEFSDVTAGTEFSNAVAWASANGIVSGYGNGIFGTDDPITREQIATIFWRYAGSPTAIDDVYAFADQNNISEWAGGAVSWARSSGVISGKPNNLFDPKGTATRAEVATLLMNYLSQRPQTPEQLEQQPQVPEQSEQPTQVPEQPTQQPEQQTETSAKTLVVYFSMPETNNPENMTQDEDNSTRKFHRL